MTVGYMKDVATANSFTFIRLLFRWRGSVWKAIYWELILWLFLFVNLRTIYDFFLIDTTCGSLFEQIVLRCRVIVSHSRTVITFALGFYVTFVTDRWWSVFMTIPWPDTAALQLSAFLKTRGRKHEAEDKSIRQSIMRYLILSYVLVFRDVSIRIRKRFPTYEHLCPTLMTVDERNLLEQAKDSRHWIPIEWALALLKTAQRKGCIENYHFAKVTSSILDYRQKLHDILSYDWISVPLVYVQSVNICTVSYFIITCLASQTIYQNQSNAEVIETLIPVYAIIEFIVFNGWLKIAFIMLNPFGLDDDDFEVDTLIERNLVVSLSYVTDFFDKTPELVELHVKLPHTIQSAEIMKRANPMHGSAVPVNVPRDQQKQITENQHNIVCQLMSPMPSTRASEAKPSGWKKKTEENTDTDSTSSRRNALKAPQISKHDVHSNSGYILNKDDLEAAVAKLLKKRLEEEEKALMLSDKTQSMSASVEKTQLSETGRSKRRKPKSPNWQGQVREIMDRAAAVRNAPPIARPSIPAPFSEKNTPRVSREPSQTSQGARRRMRKTPEQTRRKSQSFVLNIESTQRD